MRPVRVLSVLVWSLLLVLGCSGGGQDDPGPVEDGDLDTETEADAEEPEDETPPEDGDRTEDETPPEDGDLDNDEEQEDPRPRIECEDPDTTWNAAWRAPEAVEDAGFDQYTSRVIADARLGSGVNAVVGPDPQGRLILAAETGLFRLTLPDTLEALDDWPVRAYRDAWLSANGTTLAAISAKDLFFGSPDQVPQTRSAPETLTFIRNAGNRLLVGAEPGSLGVLNLNDPGSFQWYGPLMIGIADACGDGLGAWLATLSGVWRVAWETGATAAWSRNDELPDPTVTGLLCSTDLSSPTVPPLWVATRGGLVHVEAETSAVFDGAAGLPILALRGIAPGSQEQPLLLSDKGLVRRRTDGTYDYYHSRYWLPDDDVRAALALPDGDLLVATARGAARIGPERMTLAQKAAILDDIMATHHNRLGMFSPCNLTEPGDMSTSYNRDDDNDGQWTGMYLASQSFRYAVSASAQARDLARQAKDALLRLHTVTGKPGFFARSVIAPEDCESRQCEGCGEWHLSGDNQWCWKGDTSSDEYVGHIFGLSLYYDLVADEVEKAEIRDAFVLLHDGIIANGYILEDIDGKVTTHGQFNPEWMSLVGVFGDAGLNGAMILGGLRATYHMTGEPRFLDAFYELAVTHGYADYVRRIEEINLKVHTNHDSEEMSFLALATLVRYEDDPCLIPLWQEGLAYLWEVNRPERNPEFAMLYAWMSHDLDGTDLPVAIETLELWYLHGIKWPVMNSHRADYTPNPKPDRQGKPQSLEVLPYNQKQVLRWAENPYRLDHDGTGREMEILTSWLLPYWMGRYLGILGPGSAAKVQAPGALMGVLK